MFAPFFSSEVFFSRARLFLAASFPLLLMGTATETARIPPRLEMVDLAILAWQEFAIGMAISYLASLVFGGVQMAGEIAGQQIGFSMANVIDPQSGIEVPMLGFINMNLTLMIFITVKLHLILVYIMAKSYHWIGIGAMIPEKHYLKPALTMGVAEVSEMLVLGVRMAVPIMMIMLMNSVVEGFVTKTMPQMNIQVLGMPLRVILGLCVLIFTYPAICMALVPGDWTFNLHDMPEGPFGDMLMDLSEMVRAMGVDMDSPDVYPGAGR
jgi:flagellar biosynthetic protein FliR